MWFIRALSLTLMTVINEYALYKTTKDIVYNGGNKLELACTFIYSVVIVHVIYLAILGGQTIGN